MTQYPHILGPYLRGTAGDEGFQLACRECTVADLIALAGQLGVTPRHVLSDVTRGARRIRTMGKISSRGGTWIWEISLNGGAPDTDVSLGIKTPPQTQVKIIKPRRAF